MPRCLWQPRLPLHGQPRGRPLSAHGSVSALVGYTLHRQTLVLTATATRLRLRQASYPCLLPHPALPPIPKSLLIPFSYLCQLSPILLAVHMLSLPRKRQRLLCKLSPLRHTLLPLKIPSTAIPAGCNQHSLLLSMLGIAYWCQRLAIGTPSIHGARPRALIPWRSIPVKVRLAVPLCTAVPLYQA